MAMLGAIASHTNTSRRRRRIALDSGGTAPADRSRDRATGIHQALPSTRRGTVLALLGMAAAGCILLAYLSLSAQAAEASYQINRLHDQSQTLQQQQDQLRYQLARVEAAIEVDQKATALGLTHAGKWEYLPYQPNPIALSNVAPAAGNSGASWMDRLAMTLGASPAEAAEP